MSRNKEKFVNTDIARRVGSGNEVLYVYSFPSQVKEMYRCKSGNEQPINVKVGMSTVASAKQRIAKQLGTSNNENAILLLEYRCNDARHAESYVHQVLIKSGSKINSPGREWFSAKISDVVKIVYEYDNKHGNLNSVIGENTHSIWTYVFMAITFFYMIYGS